MISLFPRAPHYHFVVLVVLMSLTGCGKQRRQKQHAALAQALEQDNHAAALVHVNKVLAHTNSPQLLALKANLLYQLDRLQESKKTYEVALKHKDLLEELRADILNNYAVLLTTMGEHQKAQTLWWQLTKNDAYRTPEVAWFNLGLSAWQECNALERRSAEAQKKARLASHRFSNVLKMEPDYVDALFFKAQAELALNKKKEARSLLQKTLALAPTHQSAEQLLKTI